ncbi:MAG TPA: glycosyltransferase family 2 protein [Candidatus Eisenbacteria bacterium]|jgi:glycosyltransferase involved in cell wall biosynthesis
MLTAAVADAVLALSATFWLWLAWGAWRGRRPPALGDAPPLPDAALPSLSIVAAAKDEADQIEAATRSLLAQEYPAAQVILVDDRSRDGTGRILERLAAEAPRLHILHIESLPEGWIGKCHALARGAALADADWILFTDADVQMAPDAARLAVSLALRGGWDHLAVGPDIASKTLAERTYVGYFLAMFNGSQRPWRASDPGAREFVGIGAFNLVRREAYARAGGHERIRYEVLDDMALGKVLKESGARQTVAGHGGRVATRWHAGVGALVRGIEKNAFAAARYNAAYMSLVILLLLLFSAAPYVGWFLPGVLPRVLAATAWAGILLTYGAGRGIAGIRAWHAPLMLAGAVVYNYAMARSMLLALAHGGVRWRDTFYPLAELRRRQVY